jgi:hypothetical protein
VVPPQPAASSAIAAARAPSRRGELPFTPRRTLPARTSPEPPSRRR